MKRKSTQASGGPQKPFRRLRGKLPRTLRGLLQIKSFRVEMILIIFFLMLLTSGFIVGSYALLHLIFPSLEHFSTLTSSAATLIACTVIGTGAAAIFTKWFLRPLQEMIAATQRIAKGDFKVHIHESFAEDTDFGILQRSFNHMAHELDGIELFRKDFINNFSHEFKTPIVSIRGFAKQLERDDLTPAQRREYLDIIVSESDRLANMASNVLLLSKLENQTIVTDREDYRLDEQLRRCVLLLEKQWGEKALEPDVELEAVTYRGNEEMMNHVWVNLLNNAIKFSPRGGALSVRLAREGDAAVCSVGDRGPGMDEVTRRRIFEKFYQGDTAHATEGNGLGLALVKRIVDLCGGSVTVESAPGEGSTFTVRLPLEDR